MKSIFFLLAVFVVLAVAYAAESECQKHREKAKNIETIMKLIPKCKDNGDYAALQCYEHSHFCVCYDPKGHPASPILGNLSECGCYLRRKEKIDRNIENAYIPQCSETGAWVPKQCWDYNNSCWCVDKEGKQVGEIKAEGKGLSC
ncbi:hypothetical protein CDAR_317221 [Caerostris darwini]|uniref:Thyroglobulin type-1 domain-containing protein n=1 Tax=Caerostris darwini TaxID=1538125 RepID=A0AAV4NVH2_9ARAC|nr:hypothetical protein CDAR_317221 [Caerostris darwini]